MSRKFKQVDYEASLQQSVTLEECLPSGHLARFVVEIIQQLDLNGIYSRYGSKGGEPYAPEILLSLLLYGYATGVFSSRKIEQATYEVIPFRYIAGGLHPDHDTIAEFRRSFLPEIKDVFVQVLVVAQSAGVLKLGNISLDGSKIHADASKSKAVSYKRLAELEQRLQQEIEDLFALSEQVESEVVLPGMNVAEEIAFRQGRLVNLEQARMVLEARAVARYEAEQADYEEKMRQREEKKD